MRKILPHGVFKISGLVVLLSFIETFSYAQNQIPTQKQQEKVVNKKRTQTKAQQQKPLDSQDQDTQMPADENSEPEEGAGLFGSSIRIGPMVGFGILMGPNVGVEAKIFKNLGLSFSYAQYKKFNIFNVYDFRSQLNNNNQDFTIDSAHIDYTQIEGKISWFPWGKTFFIGTAFGKRDIIVNMGGKVNATINVLGAVSAPINVEYEVNSLYLTPQLGWLANWDGPYGGFAIGTEFGVQFSVSHSEKLTPSTSDFYAPYLAALVETTQYQEMKSQILSETGDKLKNYPFPYWNIIKVGWLF